MPVRTPEQIIESLASQRGLVTPVPPYYPLGAAFTAGCVREAYRDLIDALTDAGSRWRGNADVTRALKLVTEQVAEALKAPDA